MPMIRQYHQCRQPKRMKFIDIFESILQFKTKAIIRKNWFPFPGYHSHKIGLVPPVPSFRYMRHGIFPFKDQITTVGRPTWRPYGPVKPFYGTITKGSSGLSRLINRQNLSDSSRHLSRRYQYNRLLYRCTCNPFPEFHYTLLYLSLNVLSLWL